MSKICSGWSVVLVRQPIVVLKEWKAHEDQKEGVKWWNCFQGGICHCYWFLLTLEKMENSFPSSSFMQFYFYHKTVMDEITKFPKPGPVSIKVLHDLNEHSSLPESQRDNTRATDPWLKHRFLITCLPASFLARLQQTCWVLVSELRQIHNLALALFKSPALEKEPKGVWLTANLRSLAPSFHSWEIYSSSLRSKASSLVLFLAYLTWNNCLLQQGPLGDRRIPCCPHTGWRL